MTIHPVYCSDIPETGCDVGLDDREEQHLFKVFRANVGDRVRMFDGNGTIAMGTVLAGRRISVDEVVASDIGSRRFHLFVALPRRARQDELLKSVVEMGVASVHPIRCRRSVALSEPTDRWKLHFIEACKQSGNPTMPKLHEPTTLTEALSDFKSIGGSGFFGSVASCDVPCGGETKDVSWFVGPEGGFDDLEVEEMMSAGVVPLNLGPHVMRLETAVIAGLAVLRRMFTVFAVVSAMLCASGCGREDAANRHPLMVKAAKYREQGRYDLAAKFYARMISTQPDCPAAYLGMAELCEESLEEPIKALHYYDEYLNHIPDDDPSRETIVACRDRLERKVKESMGSEDRQKAEEKITQLEQQRDQYRALAVRQQAAIAQMRDRERKQHAASTAPATKENDAVKPGQPETDKDGKPRVHVVVSGDTLSGIARKYGMGTETLRQINGLPHGAVLRIGQRIRLDKGGN